MLTAALTGLAIGAQVGPIWLLCARSAMRHGVRVGLAIGAGAALVDLCYAALGVAGVARLVAVSWLRPILGLVGATVLAGRTLWSAFRVRSGAETDDEVGSARVAFKTAVAATASNPLTIAAWAAAFAAASGSRLVEGAGAASILVAAVGVGSVLWFTLLSCVAGWLGRRSGPTVLRGVDALSGMAVLSFAGVLGWRSLRGD